MKSESEIWGIVVKYHPAIKKMCRQSCRGREDLLDELWEEAIDRLPRIISMWDPDYGVGMWTYVGGTLRRYLWKWVNANANRLQRHEPIASDHKSYVPRYELDHREEVQLVLTHLCEYDRWLLETYYGLGYTFEEMSLTLNISKGTVRLHVQAALRRAQEYASDG